MAAIYYGYIKLEEESDLDQIVYSGTLECGHNFSVTLRDLLEQPDYAGCDGLKEAVIFCDKIKSNFKDVDIAHEDEDEVKNESNFVRMMKREELMLHAKYVLETPILTSVESFTTTVQLVAL